MRRGRCARQSRDAALTQADFERKNEAITIIFDMPMPTSPVIQSAPQPDHGESRAFPKGSITTPKIDPDYAKASAADLTAKAAGNVPI